MTANRLVAVFEKMAKHERSGGGAAALCVIAADVMNVSGAVVALAPTSGPLTRFCSSNDVAQALLELEITLGEGPFTQSTHSNEAVELSSLSGADPLPWPGYVVAAEELGARAVFAFPLSLGAIRLGALGLYHDEPGPLSEDQAVDGSLLASVVARALLAMLAGAPEGELSAVLSRESTLDFTLHQASGMVAVQGSMSVADAQVSLRARAFSTGDSLADTVKSVITRRLYFDQVTRTWLETTGEP